MTMRYTSFKLDISTRTAMLFLLVTILQIVFFVGADHTDNFEEPLPRIVGGQDADFNEYQFFTSWGRQCGATLIHDDFVLTAAHVS